MSFDIAMGVAIVFDQLFGDPRWFPHPVRGIGFLCTYYEDYFRRSWTDKKIAGIFTVAAVLITTLAITSLLVMTAFMISNIFGYCVSILIIYASIAAKDLARHSQRVYRSLISSSDIEEAREAVSMIVGRDTSKLDRVGVSRACVETVAENMVDGVTAPIFYAVVGGLFSLGSIEAIGFAAVGAMGYKAVNTMDSMFGYKNERYLRFGWAAAILDDIVNLLPARLSGFLLIPAAGLLMKDWKNATKIFFRDRLAHASPNAAHPEAAVAGALRIQLGGNSSYFGKMISKPTIGDSLRQIDAKDILVTNRLMFLGSLLTLLLLLFVRKGIMLLIL